MTKNNIYQKRKEKDLNFQSNANSPIPRLLRHKFKGLKYFEYNPKFIFKAQYSQLETQDYIKISNNFGTKENYSIYGSLSFEIEDKKQILFLFQSEASSDYLWLPFHDKSNGETTYCGGRYLDFSVKKLSNYVELDFNLAYNPYCAYNSNYACPIIPPDNHLDMVILAGELIY